MKYDSWAKISRLNGNVMISSLIVALVSGVAVFVIITKEHAFIVESFIFSAAAAVVGFILCAVGYFSFSMYIDLSHRQDNELAGIDRRDWEGSILSTGGAFRYFKEVVRKPMVDDAHIEK